MSNSGLSFSGSFDTEIPSNNIELEVHVTEVYNEPIIYTTPKKEEVVVTETVTETTTTAVVASVKEKLPEIDNSAATGGGITIGTVITGIILYNIFFS